MPGRDEYIAPRHKESGQAQCGANRKLNDEGRVLTTKTSRGWRRPDQKNRGGRERKGP